MPTYMIISDSGQARVLVHELQRRIKLIQLDQRKDMGNNKILVIWMSLGHCV